MMTMGKATRHHTRDHNARLVLKTITGQGESSRAEIARLTGLTRPTVSAIVADLLGDGLAIETGVGPSAGGKPPTLLRLNKDAYQILCLDLSGAEFRGALVNLGGEVRDQASISAGEMRGDEALDQVLRLAEALRPSVPLLGIGVGTPGLVNPSDRVVLRAVNLDWTNVPLGTQLEAATGYPAHVANDSHMAALAEYTFGPPSGSDNLIVIRVGRGIGAGIVLGGRPFYGDGFGAGEIGHIVVDHVGERCSCGNIGCLETVAGTRAMLVRARASLAAGPALDWEGFVRSVAAGDAGALEIVRDAGRALGIAAANLVGCYHIRHIVISGRVASLGPAFIDAVRAEMRRRVLPAMAAETELTYSALGGEAVLLGSAALVLQGELGII